MAVKKKRPSNNPLGRKKIEDKKVLVGVYLRQSVIDAKGGKDAIRSTFLQSIGESE